MDLRGLALLPVRVTVAATRATLGLGQLASPDGPILREGGYANRLGALIGEGGLLDQVSKILADERGPVSLANTLADLTAEDRPIGKSVRGPLPVAQLGVQVLSTATYVTCKISVDGVVVSTKTVRGANRVAVCVG